ncbi:MAG TPA: hypothetical protein VF892_01620 [Pseudonocardiaceae bacterium]
MISARRRERARWRVAYVLNRLPWQCWPTLVGWALDGKRGHGSRPRLTGSTQDCRVDADQTGACYCGKFRHPTTGKEASA